MSEPHIKPIKEKSSSSYNRFVRALYTSHREKLPSMFFAKKFRRVHILQQNLPPDNEAV